MILSLKNPLDYPVSVILKLAREPDMEQEDPKEDLKDNQEKDELQEQGKEGIKKGRRGSDGLSEKGLAKVPKTPVDNSGDNGILEDTVEVRESC